MKRSELLFATLLLPIDAAMIFAAFWLAYYTRVESGALPVSNVFPFGEYVGISVLITLVWLAIFAFMGMYSLRSTRRGLSEFSRIWAACAVGTLTVVAVVFFLRIDFFSRLVIVFAFVAAVVLVSLARLLVRVIQRSCFRYGIGVRRVIIVGTGRPAELVATELQTPSRGYRVLGFVQSRQSNFPLEPTLGTIDDISSLLETYRPDELIDAEPSLSDDDKLLLVDAAEDAGLDFRFTSNREDLATSRVTTTAIAGVPVMTVQRTPLDGWGRVMKRALDLVIALLFLPIIMLFYGILFVAVAWDSPGPVLFKQTRVGRNGREFTSYKFRSMVLDAEAKLAALQSSNEADGPVFKMKHDPRVTRIGRFLRRTSLDELPQILNVIRGEMSLVGPRPPLPAEVAHYTRAQRRRLTIKPGMTGLWQVSGRSDILFEEWVRLDVYYIQNWSLLLDLTILLKTIRVVLMRKGAY